MLPSSFLPVIQSIFEEFIPICRQLAGDQRYAISVGGSLGKGTWDSRSAIDLGAIALISLARHRSKKPLLVRFSSFSGISAMKIVSRSGEMGESSMPS